jgi:hypothetical protein
MLLLSCQRKLGDSLFRKIIVSPYFEIFVIWHLYFELFLRNRDESSASCKVDVKFSRYKPKSHPPAGFNIYDNIKCPLNPPGSLKYRGMNVVIICIYFVNNALKEGLDDVKHELISRKIL